MRRTFINQLVKIAARDKRVILLTADLGYTVLEEFSRRFPRRYLDVGVAEQNMVGLATGLAEAGFIPFVYSIATFASMRPYEFIRNGPVLHQLPVRIISIGGGFEYGFAGPTHHALEDIAIMRVQPKLMVIAPADAAQAKTAIKKTWNEPGPIYYRLGKDDDRKAKNLNGKFELGTIQVIKQGNDGVIFCMGSVTPEVIDAAEKLETQGISFKVVVVASISPAPVKQIARLTRNFSHIATVEAHYVTGGLGSLVAEVMAEAGSSSRLTRFGVSELSEGRLGSERYFYRKNSFSAGQIVDRIKIIVKEK